MKSALFIIFFLTVGLFVKPAFSTTAEICSKTNIVTKRKEFQIDYDKKNFKKAYENLKELVTECENKIETKQLLWLQNDLLLTAIKLGDWTSCLEISNAISDKKISDMSPVFQNAFKNTSAHCSFDYYFKGIDLVNTLPEGATPIKPVNDKEQDELFALMKKSDPDLDTEGATIYKGNFSNQGNNEYILITSSGTMHVDMIRIFKLINNKMVEINFDNLIEKNLAVGTPNFYYWTGRPFAFIKDNKTYLRFMEFPGDKEYNLLQLETCTYLLEGDKLTLKGPNYKFAAQSGFPLVENKNCIGAKKG